MWNRKRLTRCWRRRRGRSTSPCSSLCLERNSKAGFSSMAVNMWHVEKLTRNLSIREFDGDLFHYRCRSRGNHPQCLQSVWSWREGNPEEGIVSCFFYPIYLCIKCIFIKTINSQFWVYFDLKYDWFHWTVSLQCHWDVDHTGGQILCRGGEAFDVWWLTVAMDTVTAPLTVVSFSDGADVHRIPSRCCGKPGLPESGPYHHSRRGEGPGIVHSVLSQSRRSLCARTRPLVYNWQAWDWAQSYWKLHISFNV